MTIFSTQYTITATATLIVAADNAAEEIHIHATSGAFYIGGSDVTASNGYLLDHKDKVVVQNHGNALYGITSTGTQAAGVLVIQK
jgi:hypothetical protein